jgi:hypothetical protein
MRRTLILGLILTGACTTKTNPRLPLTTDDVSSIVRQHLANHENAGLAAFASLAPSNTIDRIKATTAPTAKERSDLETFFDDLVSRAFGPQALVQATPTSIHYALRPAVVCLQNGAVQADCARSFGALSADLLVTKIATDTLSIVVQTSTGTLQPVTLEIALDHGKATFDIAACVSTMRAVWPSFQDTSMADLEPSMGSGHLEVDWSQSNNTRKATVSVSVLDTLSLALGSSFSATLGPGSGPLASWVNDADARTLTMQVELGATEAHMPLSKFDNLLSRNCSPCPTSDGTLGAHATTVFAAATFDAGGDRTSITRVGWGPMRASIDLDGTTILAVDESGTTPGMFSGYAQSAMTGVEAGLMGDARVDVTIHLAPLAAKQFDFAAWANDDVLHLAGMGSPSIRFQDMMTGMIVGHVLTGSVQLSSKSSTIAVSASANQCIVSTGMGGREPFDTLAVGPCN